MGEFVGTAAWKVPKIISDRFAGEGTHLERYASVFNAVEINSSFYRNHKAQTYVKWAESVPESFRFAVKLSKQITHVQRLETDPQELKQLVNDYQQLGQKLGALLVQLPPSLEFDRERVLAFFESLRLFYLGNVVVEPRHRSWNETDALEIFHDFDLTRAVVDPDPQSFNAISLEHQTGFLYFRLHGSPEIYRSNYEPAALQDWADQVRQARRPESETWCIFDNTTFDHATQNAIDMGNLLKKTSPMRSPPKVGTLGKPQATYVPEAHLH